MIPPFSNTENVMKNVIDSDISQQKFNKECYSLLVSHHFVNIFKSKMEMVFYSIFETVLSTIKSLATSGDPLNKRSPF